MKNCFIIVNYNDYKSTKHLVDNIIDYKCIDQILIVDNNSKTKEKEALKTIKHKKVDILFNDTNMGYSAAINFGTRHLIKKNNKCNFIISNSDIVILSEDDLNYMINVLNDNTVGLVGPQLLELGRISRGYKNIKPSIDICLSIPILRNFIGERVYLYDDEYYDSDVSYVDVISSAFFLISSDTLKRINYLDEQLFLYYEDFILAKKVKNLDLHVAVCNNVKIKHMYSVSVDKSYIESEKYKLLSDSKFYYHVTYNNTNIVERIIMRIIGRVGLVFRCIRDTLHKN